MMKILKDVRVKWNFEIDSDHYLLVTALKIEIEDMGSIYRNKKTDVKERTKLYLLREKNV